MICSTLFREDIINDISFKLYNTICQNDLQTVNYHTIRFEP